MTAVVVLRRTKTKSFSGRSEAFHKQDPETETNRSNLFSLKSFFIFTFAFPCNPLSPEIPKLRVDSDQKAFQGFNLTTHGKTVSPSALEPRMAQEIDVVSENVFAFIHCHVRSIRLESNGLRLLTVRSIVSVDSLDVACVSH